MSTAMPYCTVALKIIVFLQFSFMRHASTWDEAFIVMLCNSLVWFCIGRGSRKLRERSTSKRAKEGDL